MTDDAPTIDEARAANGHAGDVSNVTVPMPHRAMRLPYAASGRRRRLLAVLVTVVVVLLATNVATGVLLYRSGGPPDAETAKVASRFVVNLLSFRHATLDADIAEVRADATAAFARRAGGAMGDDQSFRDSLTRAEAESEAKVIASDITSSSRDRATVVVVVEQTVRRTGVEASEDIVRVVTVTVVHTSGGWKVDDLRTVGSQHV